MSSFVVCEKTKLSNFWPTFILGKLKRKNFILLTALGLSGIAIPAIFFKIKSVKKNIHLSEPNLLSRIMDGDTITRIGQIFIKQFPNENIEDELEEALSESGASNNDSLIETLEAQIEDDFVQANIVIIDGWILSLTEARQCALFSIIKS